MVVEYIRRIMRISWTEKRQTKKWWKWPDTIDSYSKPPEKDNYNFFGHINRAVGLEKHMLGGKICGTKSRGRQRTKYTDRLNNYVSTKEPPNNDLTGKLTAGRVGRP